MSYYNRGTDVLIDMTLTPELKQAVKNAGNEPVRVEDPETHMTYLIIREDVYLRTSSTRSMHRAYRLSD